MKSANVAELKNRLSAYLEEVENGETIVVKNRTKAIAQIVPLTPPGSSEEERELVAEGKLKLPQKAMTREFLDRFLSTRIPPVSGGSSVAAVVEDRDEGR